MFIGSLYAGVIESIDAKHNPCFSEYIFNDEAHEKACHIKDILIQACFNLQKEGFNSEKELRKIKKLINSLLNDECFDGLDYIKNAIKGYISLLTIISRNF